MSRVEIRDPVHGFVQLNDEEIEIVDHLGFQRLRKIKQLALANLLYPGALHTRFDHCIGTRHVAEKMGKALGDLKGLRFVEEREKGFRAVNEEGFKVKRYDYEITEEGRRIVERIRKRCPDEHKSIVQALKEVRGAGEPDYNTLSVAAKAHFILSSQGRPMTADEIIKVARQFNWRISEDKFAEAASFLERLDLVKSQQ